MATNSTVIHTWEDEPEEGRDAEEWPYPDSYTKSLITGDLADRIRDRLGADADEPVIITEKCMSGGYSEYTQENDYEHTITVGNETVELASDWSGNGLVALTNWLDRAETDK